MQGANPGTTLGPIAFGVISNAIFAALLWGGNRLFVKPGRRNPIYRRRRLLSMVGLWFGSILIVFFAIPGTLPYFFTVSLIVVGVVVGNELNQFWKIGLVGADPEVKTGIDYITALGMCKNALDFLGIGAAKLTEHQKEFRDAIDCCNRSDKPVRLLLCRPDASGLERIARMARRDSESYKQTVSESLRFIAKLRNEEHKNISVRLYGELPAFRLMFINEAICLMSYNVFGKGDGSNLPQLHIIKTTEDRDVDSLYFGFAAYFGKLWEDSAEWNFQDFLM